MRKADNLRLSCAVVTKSGSLNLLEPSGPDQVCNGAALPLPYQPLTADTGMVSRTAGQEPTMLNPSLSLPTPNQYGQYSQRQTGASSSTDRDFTVDTPSPSLSVTSYHTGCIIDFTCV